MSILSKLISYINPLDHLGEKKYSVIFPLVITLATFTGIESYIRMTGNITLLGMLAIFIPVALIIYFSFREGMFGGIITTGITIGYYFFIIYSHHYSGQQYVSGIETTIILGILYVILAVVIGGLRQIIDVLVEKEILARQRAEEGELRLQTIIQQLPVGILLADSKSKKFNANTYLKRMLGRKIPSYLMRKGEYISTYAQKSHHASQEELPIIKALYHGQAIIGEEMEFVRKDKKQLHLVVNASPIKNLHGEVVAAVSTIYDITQIRELEQRKDDFINMASHELKTPLTSIILYSNSLKTRIKTLHDATTLKMINNMDMQINRLQKLINDLLDVSRLQTGKLTFTKDVFSIDALIRDAITSLQKATEQKIVYVKKSSGQVYADKFRVYQVITNLLTNAIKYSLGKNNIIVTLDKQGARIIISVTDYGIGIAKTQQKKIFDKLYQVSEDMNKTFPGFGMGLYISREIIKRHKGKIWVESEIGKGATFYFSLPLVTKQDG